MLNDSVRMIFLVIFLVCGATVEVEAIESDSTRAERPSFSMVPT